MPSRARALRDKNRAKKIKLSESHIDKSLDTECEERDSFFEAAHQRKKTCDNDRYANNSQRKKSYEKDRYQDNPEPKRAAERARHQTRPKTKKRNPLR